MNKFESNSNNLLDVLEKSYNSVDSDYIQYLYNNKQKYISYMDDLMKKFNISFSSENFFNIFIVEVQKEIENYNKSNSDILNLNRKLSNFDLSSFDMLKSFVDKNIKSKSLNYSLSNVDEMVNFKIKEYLYKNVSSLDHNKIDLLLDSSRNMINNICLEAKQNMLFNDKYNYIYGMVDNLKAEYLLDSKKNNSLFYDDDDVFYNKFESVSKNDDIYDKNFSNVSFNNSLSSSFVDENDDLKKRIDMNFEEVFDSLKKFSFDFDEKMIDDLKSNRAELSQIIINSLCKFSPSNYNVEKIIDVIDYDYIRNYLFKDIENRIELHNEQSGISNIFTSYKEACREEIKKYDYNNESLEMVSGNMCKARDTVLEIKNDINYSSIVEKFVQFLDDYLKDKRIIMSSSMRDYLMENILSYIKESNSEVNKSNLVEDINEKISSFRKSCGLFVQEDKKRDSLSSENIFIY